MLTHHPHRILVLIAVGALGVSAVGCNHLHHETRAATTMVKSTKANDASALRDPAIGTASTAARRMLDDVYMAIDDLRANDTKAATAALDRAEGMLPIIRLGMQTATEPGGRKQPTTPGIGLQEDLVPLEESVAVSDKVESVAANGKASSPTVEVSSREVKRLVLPVDETATRLKEAQEAIDGGDTTHARAVLDAIPDSIQSYVYAEVDENPARSPSAASANQVAVHAPSLWKLTYGPWERAFKSVEHLARRQS